MNAFCEKFELNYPIIQAGMVWCAGWRLASSAASQGILGVIGSGSMYPEVLREHIIKCKNATRGSFAVNVPLLYPQIEKHFQTLIELGVKTVITSAGNPALHTPLLKSHGLKVIHVVSSTKFALKAESAGVDAVVAEGFEAGGHNGREETTTLCLVPEVKNAVSIPVIAAGGIGSGKAMYAAMALGADGVQIGSRFVASEESSAHPSFKERVIQAREGDTVLTLKELAPVRLIKNAFYDDIKRAYQAGVDTETLRNLLGRGRSKKGMFEGDLDQGELEIGQVSASLKEIKPVADIIQEILAEYEQTRLRMTKTILR
jgi:enoyl-[acyl-carrier protein] reductase II